MRRALALLGCLVALAVVTRTDAPGTGAAFTDTADVAVALQSPDLPAFVPGLVLWLDGSDAATQFTDAACTTPVGADGDAVRCWQDRSTSEVSLVAGSANPATHETGRINGRSTVRLAQVGGVEASLVGPDVLGGSAADLQVFLVSRENVRGGINLLSLDGTTFTASRRLSLHAPYGNGSWYWDAATQTADRAIAGPTAVGATTLASLWKDSAAGSNGLRLNGVLTGVSAGSTPAVTTGGVRLGYLTPDHDIAEVLVYDRRLAPAEEAALEAYLAAKWGVAVGADSPGSATATPSADRAVTLSWQAPADDGGSPVSDYVVQYRVQGSGTWTTLADGTSTATTATVTGLTVGTIYELRVAAVTAPGTGAWSAAVTAQAMAAWTPADIAAGVDLWLDAADGASLTVADGVVSEWRDRSGLGRHATQTDPARRPTYAASDPRAGGRPTISAPSNAGRVGFGLPSFTMQHVVAVVGYGSGAETAFDGFETLVAGDGGNGAPRFGMGSEGSGAWYQASVVAGTSYPNGASASTTDVLPMPVGVQRFDLGTARTSAWTLGHNGMVSGRSWNGPIAEVVALSDPSPSLADLQRLEGYLAHEWGSATLLPADHPYRSVRPLTATPATVPGAPTAVVVVPGDGAVEVTWAVPAATGGTAIRDYRVEYRIAGSGGWLTAPDGVSSGTAATVTGLTNGTAYEVRVAAVNAAGTGTASEAPAAVTPRSYRDMVAVDGPTAWWRLGDPSGANAYNEVVSGANGTYAGTPLPITATPLVGDADRARTFNGTDQHVVAAIPSALTSGTTRSVSAWFRTTGTGIIVGQQGSATPNSGSTYVPMLWVGTDGLLRASVSWHGSSQASHVNVSPARVDDGLWHHAVATEGPSGTRLYLDGQLVHTRTGLTTSFYGATHLFVGTGRYSGWVGAAASPWFAGSIDEVAVFGTELSAERVAAHHRAGLTGTNDGVAPAAPTGLTATAGDAQVALSWNAVAAPDLAGYRVFRDGVVVRQQVGTTFTDTGLTNGTAYAYTVEAYDTRGNRSAASTAATATPASAPGAVTGLSAQAGVTSVGLTWTAGSTGGSAITDYVIEYRETGGSWSTFADGVSTATTATVTGLTTGAGYEFRVSAVNAVGTGASATTTATTAAAWTPADLPAGLTLWLDAADASTVTLNGSTVSQWNDRSGNGRHLAQGTASRQPTYATASQNGLAGVDFSGNRGLVRTGLSGVTNAWTIAVVKSPTTTWGGYHAILERGPIAGSRIGGLVQHGNTGLHWNVYPAEAWQNGASVALAGNAFTNITAANLLAFTPSTTAMTSLGIGNYEGGTQGGAAVQYETIALGTAPSTADRQRVEGYLAHKWGTVASLPANHPYKLVPPTVGTPATAPGAPTGLTVTPGHQSLSLSWTAPASDGGTVVRDYVVRYRTSPSGSWTTFADGVGTATSATVTGLAVGTAYDVEVAAINAAGTGVWSTTATASTPSLWTPADLPGGLTAWYDADSATSLVVDGGLVGQWRDRSGNGRTLTGTGAARPTVVASGQNGRTIVDFALDDTVVTDPFSVGTTSSVFAMIRPDLYGATNRDFVTSGAVSNNATAHILYNDSAGALRLYSGSNIGATNPVAAGSWMNLAGITDGAGSELRLHGSTFASGNAGTNSWSQGVRLGASTHGVGVDAAYAEVVITGAVLDVADRQRVEGYLAHKWGTTASLPAGHPYKTTPPITAAPATAPGTPTGLVAVPGDGAVSLTWTAPAATGGTPIRDYIVQYGTDSAFTAPVTVADGLSTGMSTTVAGVANGTTLWFRVAAVNAAGTGAWSTSATAMPSTLWTPAGLPGLALWLDAADATTLPAGGGSVSRWSDKSGNGRHAVQTSAAIQPTATTDSDGRAVVRFDLGDGLIVPTLSPLGSTASFTSVTRSSTANSYLLLSRLVGGGAWGWASGSTSGNNIWWGSGTPALTVDGTAFVGNSTALATTLGQATHTVSSVGVDFATWTGDVSIGRFVSSTWHYQGDVQELVFTSTVLSIADRQRLEGYLAHKWGTAALLPADHPYKVAPPRVGVPTAPTAVTSTAGDGAVTLQWAAPDPGYVVTDYTVQFKTAASGSWTTFADGTSTATTATVTGLTAGTAYELRVAAVNAAGTSAWSSVASSTTSTVWTPADLPGLALWLDADDASTLTVSSGAVAEWRDKSGNGRHAAQTTAVNRPDYTAAALNGRGAVVWPSVANARTLVTPAFATQDWWLAIRYADGVRSTWIASYQGLFGGGGASESEIGLIGASSGSATYGNGGFPTGRINGGAELSNLHRVVLPMPTSIVHARRSAGALTPSVGWYLGMDRSLIGHNRGWSGPMGEIVATASSPSDADRQRLEGYLAHKWGTTASLPTDHPYKTARPRAGLPTAPTAFTGQAVGETSVQLQWTAPDAGYGITDYVVEYRPSPSGSWTTFADGVSAGTTTTVTGLTASTAYDVRVAAVGAAGTGAWSAATTVTAGPLWTPAGLTGVALWLDGADTSSLDLSGSAVATWSDKSGSGNHATQATAGSRPTYDSALHGIDTTGAAWLGFSRQVLSGTTAASMFVVGNQTSGQSSWGMMGCCSHTHAPWSDGRLYDSFASSSRPGSPQALLFPSAGAITLLGYEQTGAELRFWQSGNALGSATTTYAVPSNSVSQQRIGTSYATSYRVHEVVVVRRVLSDADRQRLEGYLAHKWSLQAQLPVGHPYKTTPPYGS